METVLWAFVYLISIFFVWYLPGSLIVQSPRLSKIGNVTLGIAVGISMWALIGLTLGWLHARNLLLFYPLPFAILKIIRVNFQTRVSLPKHIRFDWIIALIILAGTIASASNLAFMYRYNPNGSISFCCRSVHDSIYHLVLAEELTRNFPPNEPSLSGTVVRNYHYLSNLVIADLHRLFSIPIPLLIYVYIPITLSVLLGLGAYEFSGLHQWTPIARRWLVFLIYFAGDLVYLIPLLLHQQFNMDIKILDDMTKLMSAAPRAFAITLFIYSLIALSLHLKKPRLKIALALVLLTGVLSGFKIYTFIAAASGLSLVVLYQLYRQMDLKICISALITALIALAVYLPVNGQSGNGLWFHPPYTVRHFIENPQIGFRVLELRRQVFIAHSNFPKIILYEALFIFLYFVFVFGLQLISLIPFKKTLHALPVPLHLYLIAGLLVQFILGLFSSQYNGGLNTTQFLINAQYYLVIYAALNISVLTQKIPFRPLAILISCVIVVAISFRGFYDTLANLSLVKGAQFHTFEPSEIQTYTILKNLPDTGKIALDPEGSFKQSSVFITHFTQKPLYLAGLAGILRDHGIDEAEPRYDQIKKLYLSPSVEQFQRFTMENNIGYYISKAYYLPPTWCHEPAITCYVQSDLATLYSVDPYYIKLN